MKTPIPCSGRSSTSAAEITTSPGPPCLCPCIPLPIIPLPYPQFALIRVIRVKPMHLKNKNYQTNPFLIFGFALKINRLRQFVHFRIQKTNPFSVSWNDGSGTNPLHNPTKNCPVLHGIEPEGDG
jgi:hypothetical protein